MALTYIIGDIITDAFIEMGATAPGEQPSPDEAQWGLRKANYLVDIWQALKFYVFSYKFTIYTIPTATSPVLIGPSGNPGVLATVGPRPVKIESAAQLLNNGSETVFLPIQIRGKQWYEAQQVPLIQTNVITDLWYDPTSPDGSLYFWPVLNTSNQVRLETWDQVSQFDSITDAIGGPGGPGTLPPAYRAALMLTLAELLCPGGRTGAPAELKASALAARNAIFQNNVKSPRVKTSDAGMPRAGRSGVRGDFNWETGGAPGGRPE